MQETRHYHEEDGTTSAGRVKSDSEDYRYFPEPDLVPVAPDPEWVEELREGLPEPRCPAPSHQGRVEAFRRGGLRDLVNARAIDLVEDSIKAGATPAGARKWWMGDISRFAKESEIELEDAPVTPADIAELDKLVGAGKLNDKLARRALKGVLAGQGTPAEVVAAKGLEIVSDDGALVAAVDEALAANPDVLEKIKGGKVQAAGAIVGAVMRRLAARLMLPPRARISHERAQ